MYFDSRFQKYHKSIHNVIRSFEPIFTVKEQKVTCALNVYNLTSTKMLTSIGIGIHHSGWVFNKALEVGFGYADLPGTGVYSIKPGMFNPLNLLETVKFPGFKIDKLILLDILARACEKFPARSYDLLRLNCNDFSDYIARMIGLADIPSWINRAAKIGQKFTREP